MAEEIEYEVTEDGRSLPEVREELDKLAIEGGTYCGLPLPLGDFEKDCGMVIHPSLSFAEALRKLMKPEPPDPEIDNLEVANIWWSTRHNAYVSVFHETIKNEAGERVGSKFKDWYFMPKKPVDMMLKTLWSSAAWDVVAEQRAMEMLKRHVKPPTWESYFLTGMFVETSKKSGLIYVFRKLRPTIVLSYHGDDGLDSETGHILCCLCAHPIGHYKDSFAGAMVPTDDVISHLLMMRSDEHRYWKESNQIEPWMPEAGIS